MMMLRWWWWWWTPVTSLSSGLGLGGAGARGWDGAGSWTGRTETRIVLIFRTNTLLQLTLMLGGHSSLMSSSCCPLYQTPPWRVEIEILWMINEDCPCLSWGTIRQTELLEVIIIRNQRTEKALQRCSDIKRSYIWTEFLWWICPSTGCSPTEASEKISNADEFYVSTDN